MRKINTKTLNSEWLKRHGMKGRGILIVDRKKISEKPKEVEVANPITEPGCEGPSFAPSAPEQAKPIRLKEYEETLIKEALDVLKKEEVNKLKTKEASETAYRNHKFFVDAIKNNGIKWNHGRSVGKDLSQMSFINELGNYVKSDQIAAYIYALHQRAADFGDYKSSELFYEVYLSFLYEWCNYGGRFNSEKAKR